MKISVFPWHDLIDFLREIFYHIRIRILIDRNGRRCMRNKHGTDPVFHPAVRNSFLYQPGNILHLRVFLCRYIQFYKHTQSPRVGVIGRIAEVLLRQPFPLFLIFRDINALNLKNNRPCPVVAAGTYILYWYSASFIDYNKPVHTLAKNILPL